MTGPITAGVAELICDGTPFDDEAVELARLHVLDTLAAVVACHDLRAAEVARRYARLSSGGQGGSTIVGTGQRATLLDAVFAGAMTAHAAEINDFMPSVFVQPGPSVVTTALGVAEDRGRSGADLIHSVIVGYELAARIPRAIGDANLRTLGLASHGVGPVFGCAATAAALLRFGPDEVGELLSCCVQQASGSWQWLHDVEHVEKAFVFAGMGTRNGLSAALLVEAGYGGVPGSLDNPGGWFASDTFDPAGDRDTAALSSGRSSCVAMADAAFKRYPVGGPTQPAVAALLDLAPLLVADEVTAVEIAMPGRAEAFRDAGMPALNLRYLSAIILIDGVLDFVEAQSLDRMRQDERVGALMARVDVTHDPTQETGAGRSRAQSARVVVRTADGAAHERYVGHVLGFPTNPMSRCDVEAKAAELMGPHLSATTVARVISTCRTLDAVTDAGVLIDLVAR